MEWLRLRGWPRQWEVISVLNLICCSVIELWWISRCVQRGAIPSFMTESGSLARWAKRAAQIRVVSCMNKEARSSLGMRSLQGHSRADHWHLSCKAVKYNTSAAQRGVASLHVRVGRGWEVIVQKCRCFALSCTRTTFVPLTVYLLFARCLQCSFTLGCALPVLPLCASHALTTKCTQMQHRVHEYVTHIASSEAFLGHPSAVLSVVRVLCCAWTEQGTVRLKCRSPLGLLDLVWFINLTYGHLPFELLVWSLQIVGCEEHLHW